MDLNKECIYDKNGREIMPGDTIKVFHFIGPRRKRYYMYKFIEAKKANEVGMWYTVSHLSIPPEIYPILADGKIRDDIEIVQGYGGPGNSFEDRPKIKRMV